jgi:hypothetical protein
MLTNFFLAEQGILTGLLVSPKKYPSLLFSDRPVSNKAKKMTLPYSLVSSDRLATYHKLRLGCRVQRHRFPLTLLETQRHLVSRSVPFL